MCKKQAKLNNILDHIHMWSKCNEIEIINTKFKTADILSVTGRAIIEARHT